MNKEKQRGSESNRNVIERMFSREAIYIYIYIYDWPIFWQSVGPFYLNNVKTMGQPKFQNSKILLYQSNTKKKAAEHS